MSLLIVIFVLGSLECGLIFWWFMVRYFLTFTFLYVVKTQITLKLGQQQGIHKTHLIASIVHQPQLGSLVSSSSQLHCHVCFSCLGCIFGKICLLGESHICSSKPSIKILHIWVMEHFLASYASNPISWALRHVLLILAPFNFEIWACNCICICGV